jgi:hypothetical protein
MFIAIKIGKYFRLEVRLDDISLVDLIQITIWIYPLIVGIVSNLR